MKFIKRQTDPYCKARRSKQKNKTENIYLNEPSCRLVENGRAPLRYARTEIPIFFSIFIIFLLFVSFFLFSFFRGGVRPGETENFLFLFLHGMTQSASVLNSGAHSFRRLGGQKLPCFFYFPVSRARPEKLCEFYWLQLQITCKSG